MMSNIVIPTPYIVSVRNINLPQKMKRSLKEDDPQNTIQQWRQERKSEICHYRQERMFWSQKRLKLTVRPSAGMEQWNATAVACYAHCGLE